jgi:hypothetical protein
MKTLVQVLEWQGGPAVWRSRESVPWPFCVLMMWFMILRHEDSMERPELKKSEGIWHGTVLYVSARPRRAENLMDGFPSFGGWNLDIQWDASGTCMYRLFSRFDFV